MGIELPQTPNRKADGVKTGPPLAASVPAGPLPDAAFGSSQGPRFVHREMPIYPRLARRSGQEGKVLLRLTIDDRGGLVDVEALESADPDFTESALVAARRSLYAPAVRDGKPVPCRALLPVRFELRRSE